jgi:hypothetical protein
MAVRSLSRAAAIAATLVLALSGCGGDDDGKNGSSSGETAAPKVEEFPNPAGKTLDEIRRGLGPGPVLAPAVSVLEPGDNRFSFGLFDRSRRQIAETPTVLYIAETDGGEVLGPFPARNLALEVSPAFRSETVSNDPDAAKSIYVAQVKFPRPGDYEVLGVARLDDRLVAADRLAVRVTRGSKVPEVGERAPKIDTPTRESVGGDVAQIDTRVPPGSMHEENLADVVGRKPAILLFATPALCQSRLCGPVVDILEQVKAENEGEDVAWIHMEIYNENEVQKGFRPQIAAFNLPTEPWLFAIDREGKVAARIENAFNKGEAEAALRAAQGR